MLDPKQRGVMRHMLLALAVSIVVLLAAILWQPASLTPLAVPAQRLFFTLQWDSLVLLCLVLAIGNLARHRFFTPADIDGSGLSQGTDRAHVLQAVLQNTLEQAAIAFMAHLLWTAVMPRDWMAAIPAAAILFAIGRALFAFGYRRGAPARDFGFALTFYPTAILTLVAVVSLVLNLLGLPGPGQSV
ncbi:MAG: MAPEG family protein [Sneathiellaceae bacterium]